MGPYLGNCCEINEVWHSGPEIRESIRHDHSGPEIWESIRYDYSGPEIGESIGHGHSGKLMDRR